MPYGSQTEQSRNQEGSAIADDSSGDFSTNISSVNVILTNSFYAYDQNGNLTNDGFKNFAYDDENELIAVWVTNAWSNSFAYDGKMRRRIERDYSWRAGTSAWTETNEVHFIYDRNLVVEERNVSNVPLVSYTRGIDLSGTFQGAGGIGGLLARTTYGQELPGAPTTAFYHADGNGNVTALLYPNQQLAAKYVYDPFGNMLAMNGPLMNFNKYRFSSKEWNENPGLYYYLYRSYNPSLQRWHNRDPLGDLASRPVEKLSALAIRYSLSQRAFSGFDINVPFSRLTKDGPNNYWSFHNDPIAEVDPFGTTTLTFGCPPGTVGGGGGPAPHQFVCQISYPPINPWKTVCNSDPLAKCTALAGSIWVYACTTGDSDLASMACALEARCIATYTQ